MKILFSSYSFSPNIGGIESVSAVLAEKFTQTGHDVELITQTPAAPSTVSAPASGASQHFAFRVTRLPSFWKLLRLLFWSDIVLQNNISLRSLLPALLLGKRVIVIHQTWLQSPTGGIG